MKLRSACCCLMAAFIISGLLYFCAQSRAGADVENDNGAVDFEQSIAPLVITSCLGCHNASEKKGGLDLTTPEGLLAGGDSGLVVVAGDPQKSLLIERLHDGSMPPQDAGITVTDDDVALIARWISQGADWPDDRVLDPFEFSTKTRAGYDWWSLRPIVRQDVPSVRHPGALRNRIDAFIEPRLEEVDLQLADEADKTVLLRRITFDLIGLPPTVDEIEDFLADDAPDAYERVVDRLLASPHYGERWGRHWLDVVRFGESHGYELDSMRPHAWRYRDYVIDSLNADKPYDEFVREQLAGDAMTPITRDRLVATGFLVAGPWDEVQNVAASANERQRAHEEQMEELIAAVSQTFLGLTANCSRCHDHKFDPISQTDYYRMKAIFDGVEHRKGNEAADRSILTPEEVAARDARLSPLQSELTKRRQLWEAHQDTRPLDFGVTEEVQKLADVLTAGRFGQAWDARKASLTTVSQPKLHRLPLTIECWAKVFSKSQFNILVASSAKESNRHWEIYTYAGSGEFSLYMPGFAPAEIKSGVEITDGEWHHVAAQIDETHVKLFVDGRETTSVDVKRTGEGGEIGNLSIGAIPPHNLGCDGIIDDVRISTGLRQITGIPTDPFAADEQTVALWHLDEFLAGVIRDTSRDEIIDRQTWNERNAQLQADIDAVQQQIDADVVPLAYIGTRHLPPPTLLFERGDILHAGEEVQPAGLTAVQLVYIHREPWATISATGRYDWNLTSETPEGERRLAFAEWVTDPRHPLTARVIVNRLWQYHFGSGLVENSSDFGFQSGPPTHPELLDDLAGELINGEWSLKDLHRLMVTSATYRQSSAGNEQALAIDADNRLYWRYSPRRLDAEIVRDAMLAASGELNARVGGASFQPFTVTKLQTSFYHLFDSGEPEFNRRSIYRMQINTGRSPFLEAFDCPAPSLAMPQRRSTTTTLQALALMNDSFVLRQTERMAERIARSLSNKDRVEHISRAMQLTLGRQPTAVELSQFETLVEQHGLNNLCWVLLNTSEFLYVR
ncbi:MAG: DUF1553 domain-containing protein [Planctomycetota bacterium]|nr:DUF1553 domain-containing protein [Planctomycetota bacterium]MDA1214713.1 DUF1553 domain-containing protein [Planctomycetota bacterium]